MKKEIIVQGNEINIISQVGKEDFFNYGEFATIKGCIDLNN